MSSNTYITYLFRKRRLSPLCNNTASTALRERFTCSVDMWSAFKTGKVSKHLVAERAFVLDTKGNVRACFDFPPEIADTTAWSHFICFLGLCDYPVKHGHTGLIGVCGRSLDKCVKKNKDEEGNLAIPT
jgi:hypothetical protein